ncbi:PepSY-associated TM helix domain-containing protein [Methylocaldum sp.]|uniref:PepSY-associated TM helix domain-containing protein n=1 Tax=Methylocaldum sp. TaxID=1969727 RepID=UPI002D4308F4|nr:PepSY-associated TM helix domain-containing protein [Methylocaldum sp.]HYE37409.1 PepSY-associated TM helix domain-containing protein [Methylocaldum sp.]
MGAAEFGLSAPPPRVKPSGGYLFLPRRLARGAFLKWLRRVHAWIGLWGAALGLLFGTTGILLNHREMMKIPVARMEQNMVQLPLPEPRPADPEALAEWLGQTLNFASGRSKSTLEPGKTVIWNGVAVQQPARWQVALRTPQRFVQAEYWEGNAFVTVKRGEANFFALLNNLHRGVSLGAGWILLVDTLAGGLVVLSLTGVLLWTRLHGRRLAAAGLGLSSLGLGLWFAWQAL